MAGASQTVTVGGGRYELKRKLGSGGFGNVYYGLDLDEGGEVAVKLFKSTVTLDQALLEAQLQRRLSEHPRVVSLRNVDARTSTGPIVVTEYRPAGSVADRIGLGSAGLLLALRWTRDAADGLVHAHAQGIFHRDAKPSNLLLDGTGHASLCDFGVAEDNLTGRGGTAVYPSLIAPELAQTGTTEQTEVWMLGVLFYRLLFGQYPYPGGAIGVPPGTEVAIPDPQVPAALIRVLRRALALDPADRYPSVAGLRADLLAASVVTEFRPVASPSGALARWEATIPVGLAIVEVTRSPKSTFTARLRIDRGNGPRTVNERPRRSTEKQAMRDARTLLRAVVEGRAP
jgi:eukaryotic-like serine/threonine-protein kinase